MSSLTALLMAAIALAFILLFVQIIIVEY